MMATTQVPMAETGPSASAPTPSRSSAFSTFLSSLEQRPVVVVALPLIAFLVGGWRCLFEQLLQRHGTITLGTFVHYSVFYVAAFFVVMAWLPALTRRPWRHLFWIGCIGLLVGIAPPLVDTFARGLYQVHYTYAHTWTPFFYAGPDPLHGSTGVSPGEAVGSWLTLAGVVGYVWWTTRSLWRSLLGAACIWASLQLLGYGTVLAYEYIAPLLEKTAGATLARDGLATALLAAEGALAFVAAEARRLRSATLKGLHIMPFVAALAIGGACVGALRFEHAVFAVLLALTGLLLFVQNDAYDVVEDQAAGHPRDITPDEASCAHVLLLTIVLAALFMRPVPGIALALFYLTAAAYHLPLLRLKQVLLFNYLCEGLSGALAIIMGAALTALNAQLHNLRDPTVALLACAALLGFSVGSTIKDDKDIAGDRAAGVQTIHVILEARGWRLARVRLLVFLLVTAAHECVVLGAYAAGAPLPHCLIAALVSATGFYVCVLRMQRRLLALELALTLDVAVLGWLLFVLTLQTTASL
jgi:4-hydroxybenzoate polyprenyltransferase